MIKNKKIGAFAALVTAISLLFSLGASAAGAGSKSGNGATKAANAAARLQLVQAVSDQNAVRKQVRDVVVQIRQDLAGTANVAALTSTQDYKDVISALNSAKTALTGNVNHKVWQQYKGASDKTAALTAALQQISANTDALKSVLASLQAALPKTANIAAQKQTLLAAANSFKTSAEAKKATIEAGHSSIAQLNEADSTLINQIVATASANKDLLASNPDEVTKLSQALTQVSSALKEEYDGKVAAAQKLYDQYRKAGQYDQALAQLDAIISIQANRVTVLNNVQAQLKTALGDLNALVSASGTATASSQAA